MFLFIPNDKYKRIEFVRAAVKGAKLIVQANLETKKHEYIIFHAIHGCAYWMLMFGKVGAKESYREFADSRKEIIDFFAKKNIAIVHSVIVDFKRRFGTNTYDHEEVFAAGYEAMYHAMCEFNPERVEGGKSFYNFANTCIYNAALQAMMKEKKVRVDQRKLIRKKYRILRKIYADGGKVQPLGPEMNLETVLGVPLTPIQYFMIHQRLLSGNSSPSFEEIAEDTQDKNRETLRKEYNESLEKIKNSVEQT